MREILLPEFFDTALIVKDENYLLFSEDERLRQISSFEFGVQGTWMQPTLQVLNDKNLISKQKFDDAMVTLASSNMEHISINASTILESGRKSKWLPTFPFTRVVKRLGNNQSELISSLSVAVQFLFELENEIVIPERHEGLVVSLLANLTFERNRRTTLKKLRQIVGNRFRLLPIQERQIINIINTWEATQSIIW